MYMQLSPIMDTIHQELGPNIRLYSFFTSSSAKPRWLNLIKSNYVTNAISTILTCVPNHLWVLLAPNLIGFESPSIRGNNASMDNYIQ